ncbi:guanylate kinase [Candidatus Saccharibacteria bacterium]|jgi:guanylate kinase|nr:guanylate kinase [Candidatus Saccharibacteria bacterium]MBP9131593.1 guanylate kinase [Candidatus Saccharibacteria bacterium]
MSSLKIKIDDYQMSTSSQEILNNTDIVMMVSISGGGKNTIIEELLKTGKFHYVVSHTTRKPRINNGQLEKNGINYWFMDEQEMSTKLDAGEFIEAKWVHESYVYGTSIDELSKAQASGKTPLLEIEVQGVEEIMNAKPDAKAIFILPPSYDIWMSRLDSRGKVSDEDQKQRLETAKLELKTALRADYFHFLVNDGLARSVEVAKNIIASGEDDRSGRSVAEHLLERLDK